MPGADHKAEKYARYRHWWASLSPYERAGFKDRNAPQPQRGWQSDEEARRVLQQLIDHPERGRARLRRLRGFE